MHALRVVVATGHSQIGRRSLRASSRLAEWKPDRVGFRTRRCPPDAKKKTEARRISAGLCPVRFRDPQEDHSGESMTLLPTTGSQGCERHHAASDGKSRRLGYRSNVHGVDGVARSGRGRVNAILEVLAVGVSRIAAARSYCPCQRFGRLRTRTCCRASGRLHRPPSNRR
jgi:hypothetical protein